MNKMRIAEEVFLSLIKYFLIVLVINNLIWAAIHFSYIFESFSNSEVNTIEASQVSDTGDNTIKQGGNK